MTKKMKKNILKYMSVGSVIIPSAMLMGCNIRQGREIKDNALEDKVWDSKEWKGLEKTIQNQFKDAILKDMYINYFFNNNVDINKPNTKTTIWGLSEISKAKTSNQLSRLFLEKNNGTENYASKKLKEAFAEIRKNILVPESWRMLLNKINTVYNRTINLFPTKTYIHEINNQKYVHVEFRADLITPMKRRFVKKFTDLKFDFPIFDQDKENEYSRANTLKAFNIEEAKMNDVNQFSKSIDNYIKMYLIIKSTANQDDGYDVNGIIPISEAYSLLGDKQLVNLKAGFYPIDPNNRNELYQPTNTGNIETLEQDPNYEYTFANWHTTIPASGNNPTQGSSDEFGKFKAADKVQALTDKIKEHYFTNSQIPLYKALFNENDGDWEIDIKARTWAGNDASNYTIADWVENIGQRGDFWIYMINKNDKSQSYSFNFSAGMASVKEDA